MRRRLKLLLMLVLSPALFVALYLSAAMLGSLIPATADKQSVQDRKLDKPVFLISNLLHADIAVPLNSYTLQKFDFLREAGFPLDNPNLKYLVIGWGSKAFYTSTKDYSDMEFSTIWRAATGDEAVIHIAPAGDISKVEDVVSLDLSETQFVNLVAFIDSYLRKENGQPLIVEGATFGFGDVFYEGDGFFHLFNPCNVWVADALRAAGQTSGYWTPTTYSLLLGLKLHNQSMRQP